LLTVEEEQLGSELTIPKGNDEGTSVVTSYIDEGSSNFSLRQLETITN
jgi:hypothetical protein